MSRAWTPEQIAFVRDTHAALTAVEQAGHLGRSYRSVVTKRHRLGLDAHTRAYKPPYRPVELMEAEDRIANGARTEDVARSLGREAGGLRAHLARTLGAVTEIRARPIARVWSLRALARLLGVEESTTWNWYRQGVIKVSGRNGRRQQLRLVTEEALLAWLADRTTWPRWEPARITDPELRAYAQDLRDAAGGRWLNAPAVADLLGYAPGTVRDWFNTGRLPTDLRIGRERFVWSTRLESFTPPVLGGDRRRAA